jgi:putative addiction module component (TIGR02574 family)
MTFEDMISAFGHLTPEERLLLMEAVRESIVDSVVAGDVEEELHQWQKDLLDERLATANASPGEGKPWREVLDRLMKK